MSHMAFTGLTGSKISFVQNYLATVHPTDMRGVPASRLTGRVLT